MSRSVQFPKFGPASVLEVVDGPEPHAAAGQVRVAVKAVGLNPFDSKVRGGQLQEFIPIRPPAGLGSEFAGVLDEVGGEVSGFQVGDEVFGTAASGALAEHVVVRASNVARKPAEVSWEVASALAIAGSAGYNSFSSLGIGPDDTVLVSAAAGGVGGVASQLAKRAGATVIGTASESNHDYLRSMGIIPVSYGPGLVQRIHQVAPAGITAALENNGSEAIEAALELGVNPARINTIVGNSAQYGVGSVGGSQDPKTLDAVAGLVACGELSLPIEAVFGLDDAVAAYERLDARHLRGKVIVRVSD